MNSLLRVWSVFVSLKGSTSNPYCRSIMLHLYHLWYWEQSDNPCLSFVRNSPMNFVEEDGEISLALLAHNCARHSIKFDHKSLSDLYQLIGLYRDTCFDTMSDLGLKFNKQKHTAVQVTDDPVKTIVEHFTTLIRDLRNCNWSHYRALETKQHMFLSREEMKPFVNVSVQKRLRPNSFAREVRKVMLNLEHLLFDTTVAGLQYFAVDSSSCSTEVDENTGNIILLQFTSVNKCLLTLYNQLDQGSASSSLLNPHLFPVNNPIPQTTAQQSVADSSNSSSSSTEQLLHDAHMSRQRRNINKQKRGTKRKAKSQTGSSTSASSVQPLPQHKYYDRQFSIAYIHYARYSLARGAEYKVHWTNFPDCREDTWETEQTLQVDCPQILQNYKDNI